MTLRDKLKFWILLSNYIQMVVRGTSPLSLPDALDDKLLDLKAYGDCENRNLPEGYQELEYIEGNNNVQYINTGIVPTSSMSMYFKGQFISVDASTPGQVSFLAGARDVGGQYGFFLQLAATNVGLDWFVVNGRWTENHTRANNDIIEMRVNNSLAQIWLNGTSVGTHQYTPDDTTQYPLFLNGLNSVGQPFSNFNSINRVYRFTIEGIADMRPARRLSDGVLGMYDTIRKRFFTNAGTGTFIAGAVVALPEGYTRLGFLQTTKTPQQCYFDTGKNFNSNYTYEVSFMKGGNANAVMGARVGNYNAKGNFAVTYVTQTAVYSSTSSASTAVDMGDTTLDEKHTVRYCQRDSLLTWDGADKWKSDWINSENIPYNMYLFAMNQANTVQGSRSGYLRIYTYKVYDGNGILIQDLVPAVRNSDNAMGLYDTVADEFLLAKGSSVEFTGSPVYTPTPTTPQDIWCNNGVIKAIRPIKYLESTGTQYIDTGVVPNQDTRVELDGQMISTAAAALFGVRTDATTNVYAIQRHSSGKYAMGYNDSFCLTDVDADTNRHVWYKNKNLQYIDGNLAFTANYSNFTAMGTAILFGFNNNGSKASSVSLRVYSCKIWDSDTLIRDFIPALDANNIPCMFDKVEGKCYYNAGTGQFIAGYLPAEYEELDYIQGYCSDSSDSTIKAAYIDTGIILPANANFYLKSQLASSPTTNSYLMCGTRTTVYAGSEIYVGSANTVIDWYGSAESDRLTINNGGSAGDIYEIYGNNKTLTVFKNGSNIGYKTFSSPTTPTLTFWLNSRNTNNQVTSQTAPTLGRIYRFTVAGVCDMIPARKRSNGHIGMYDLVRRQFFENAGEGQFTFGKLPILPDGYTQLEYLESTGTQYINTGFVPDANTKVELVGSGADISGGTRFGSRTAVSDSAFMVIRPSNESKISITISDASVWASSKTNYNKFVIDAKNKTGYIYYDDGTSESHTFTFSDFTGTYPLALFGVNVTGSFTGAASMKIKSTKIWDNGTLVRDFIPAKRKSDNVVGMYDIMNDVFYTNQGTGDFVYGSEIPTETFDGYYVDGVVEKVGTRSAGNKNLFNGIFEQGGIYQGSKVSANTRIRTPNPLSFPAGTYTVSCGSAYEIWVEKNNESGISWGDSKTITVTASSKIMIAVRNKTDPSTTLITPDEPVNVQVEAGSTATAYVPYCDGGLAVCENLLGIDSTQDVQEILTGSITRKVAVWVFNGTESWSYDSTYKRFIITTPKQMKPGGTRATPLLSTHFDCYDEGGAYSAVPNNQFYKTGQYLHFKTTDWAGVTQWTAWLRQQYDSGTPVIVVYPLSADETESVAGQALTVSGGNNTAEILQASIDGLEIEAKYLKVG